MKLYKKLWIFFIVKDNTVIVQSYYQVLYEDLQKYFILFVSLILLVLLHIPIILLPFVEDNKLGYIDTNGNCNYSAQFDSEFNFYRKVKVKPLKLYPFQTILIFPKDLLQ